VLTVVIEFSVWIDIRNLTGCRFTLPLTPKQLGLCPKRDQFLVCSGSEPNGMGRHQKNNRLHVVLHLKVTCLDPLLKIN